MTRNSDESDRRDEAFGAAILDMALAVLVGTLIAGIVGVMTTGDIQWQSLALAVVFSGLIVIAARRQGWSVTRYVRALGRDKSRVDDDRDVTRRD